MRRVGHHDVGGDPALATATVPADVPLHAWELEAHALRPNALRRLEDEAYIQKQCVSIHCLGESKNNLLGSKI